MTHLNKPLRILLITFVIVFSILVLGYFIWYGEIVKAFGSTTLKSFFEIRLVEIVQIIITILVAVYVTYLLNTVVNFEVKKRDIFDKLLTNFQDNLSELVQQTYEYINKPDKEKERRITLAFKNLSILLGIILDIEECNKPILKIENSLSKDFYSLKENITDTPFGQKMPKYSAERLSQIQGVYGLLLGKLYKCKLMLYS